VVWGRTYISGQFPPLDRQFVDFVADGTPQFDQEVTNQIEAGDIGVNAALELLAAIRAPKEQRSHFTRPNDPLDTIFQRCSVGLSTLA